MSLEHSLAFPLIYSFSLIYIYYTFYLFITKIHIINLLKTRLTLKNLHAELAIPNFFSIIAHKRQLLLCPSPLSSANDSARDILFGQIGRPLSFFEKSIFQWRKIIFSICLITVWYSNFVFFFLFIGFPFSICYLYSLYTNFNAFNSHNGNNF